MTEKTKIFMQAIKSKVHEVNNFMREIERKEREVNIFVS
jgi:hypothetical protein